MVTPPDFLRFSADFSDSDDEIRLRAAISRAYYAAFHHLQAIAEDRIGLPRFGTADDHYDILVAIREINRPVARDYEHLRRWRVLADYRLERGVAPEDALLCHEAAARVLAFD